MSQSWTIPPEIEREMTPAVRAFFEALRKSLFLRIEELEDKVDVLQQELKKHEHFRPPPKPPDAGGDAADADLKGGATKQPKRRRGGQPGHPKADRTLIPSEQCHQVVTCKPPACRGCGTRLKGEDPDPLRHQVTKIPPIIPEVIEYQRHRFGLFVLRHLDLRRTSGRRACGNDGTTTGRHCRHADGPVPAE